MKPEVLVDHDAKVGPLTRCQITGSDNLHCLIDLGHQPPCDNLLTTLDQPEVTYPLRLMHCPDSGLAQLDYVVDGREIYPPSYPYKAGISWPIVEAHKRMAKDLVTRFGTGFHVDIGSNDGTLLQQMQLLGCNSIGVEPTDIAKESKVYAMQEFFDEDTAYKITCTHHADIVTMTNVFAHMADLGKVMRGLDILLAKRGVFVTESHYLLDILDKNQFDTVYHEHIRTYSLKSLVTLFPMYGMEVFHVERHERYGGNIRAYVCRKGEHQVSPEVTALLRHEELVGLHEPETWVEWRKRIQHEKERFLEYIYSAKQCGESIAGCSAPGRCSTLLNYYGLGPDTVEYIGELQDSLKLGKYLPGTHIPIVSNKRFIEDQPDNLILLAWHYADPIMRRLRSEGVNSRLLIPLPQFTWIEN